MKIGEYIRMRRKAAKLTQQELGDLLGVTGAQIGKWENGVRNPKIETIRKILKTLEPYKTDSDQIDVEDLDELIKAQDEIEEMQEYDRLDQEMKNEIDNLDVEGKRKLYEFIELLKKAGY